MNFIEFDVMNELPPEGSIELLSIHYKTLGGLKRGAAALAKWDGNEYDCYYGLVPAHGYTGWLVGVVS